MTAAGNWTKRRSAESVERHLVKGKAAGRAKQRLINAHRGEYERYLDEEMARDGLERRQ